MSGLNPSQFYNAEDIEEKQRRRFKRKRESGFVGNGYWYAGYPYMIGAMGTGGNATSDDERGKIKAQEPAEQHGEEAMGAVTNGVDTTGVTGATSDGGGMGGTATGVTGGLGT